MKEVMIMMMKMYVNAEVPAVGQWSTSDWLAFLPVVSVKPSNNVTVRIIT